jgi:hypothetical protein
VSVPAGFSGSILRPAVTFEFETTVGKGTMANMMLHVRQLFEDLRGWGRIRILVKQSLN